MIYYLYIREIPNKYRRLSISIYDNAFEKPGENCDI